MKKSSRPARKVGQVKNKVAVDTNVLVRAVVGDDPAQAPVKAKILNDAKLIAVAMPCLCEFMGVLRKVYGFHSGDATPLSPHYFRPQTWSCWTELDHFMISSGAVAYIDRRCGDCMRTSSCQHWPPFFYDIPEHG